eukprot:TRINITY_DN4030_c0_g1_i1.p1 TRINITY_DN4030_c0_g1~~TRINITY_DN4030_c0_g1_i1.p1  ORF type:complete len:587 (-),score=87.08 TRINITY_DN4030_c0_g1_i1:9-1640(-)
MDWVNQPNPFRRFRGAPITALPILAPEEQIPSPAFSEIHRTVPSPQPVSITSLSRFFEFSLALSAWKQLGQSRWALRSNPSSGNLHPTEGYVILPSETGLTAGVYHYAPREHALELRKSLSPELLSELLKPFPPGAFLFALSSIHWRESWKYGERAFRYCNHDIGHALASSRVATSTLGWDMALLDGVSQDLIGSLLGTSRDGDFPDALGREHPDCIAVIWPVLEKSEGYSEDSTNSEKANLHIPMYLEPKIVEKLVEGDWMGTANQLSEQSRLWSVIREVAHDSWKKVDSQETLEISRKETTKIESDDNTVTAGKIIHQRRSAVDFDGVTSISSVKFLHMLERLMPHVELKQSDRPMPWDLWPYSPNIHLLIFVHRVDGIVPGIYLLARSQDKIDFLKENTSPHLSWTTVPGTPEDLPLFLLQEGDVKELAKRVSCNQDIAGDSAFSFGMFAEFEQTLEEKGAWFYPRLFWETGILGQIMYLEAESAGVRGTGIGCFYDNPVHEILGFKGEKLQSLYHFTVGGPIEDTRLTTLPPYFHLQKE